MVNVSDSGQAVIDQIAESVSLKISVAGLVLILLASVINQGKIAAFVGIYGVVFFALGILVYGLLITIRTW